MEPEKTVNKKRMNFHVNSSTTVKRRSKNFYTVQTRTSGAVSVKLLLWWNEKYPFRNAKIVVKNRTSVYCLLPRTFSLKFFTCIDANVLYQFKNPQGSLALHISLMRNEGARWTADTSLQRLNMKNTRS